MALRLQLAPPALNTLAGCPSSIREMLQHELGALVATLPLDGLSEAHHDELAVLACGYLVRYRLEQHQGLLMLTDMHAPAR